MDDVQARRFDPGEYQALPPRSYDELLEQAQTLALMDDVSRELTAILDLEELLRRIAQRVKRLIDYQLFCVMLWNEQTQLLEHSFSLRYDERIVEKGGFPLGYGLCGTAALLRQPVRVPEVALDPRYVHCGHGVEVHSELVVPLLVQDRLIGILDLESTSRGAFTAHHERMLTTLASPVAIALENARLYERVRENERRLQHDLAMAREVQQQLLRDAPRGVPGLDLAVGYLPARELGGDFYDFLPYGDGRLAIAVGDVAGKGTAAALFGSLAVGILREHAVGHPCPPAEMLEMMNRRLQQPCLDSRFVAMAFAVYDARARSLALANAGFPRPLLMRNGRVERIAAEGVPLGLLPDVRYEEKTLTLDPSDLVVFCSDGIHEAMNGREEEFGLERLGAMVAKLAQDGSAREIADGILRAMEEHAGSSRGPGDDCTVVVLKAARE